MGVLQVIAKSYEEDPVGTEILVKEAVQNWILEDLIDEKVQPLLGVEMARRISLAKAALGRQYVSKSANRSFVIVVLDSCDGFY